MPQNKEFLKSLDREVSRMINPRTFSTKLASWQPKDMVIIAPKLIPSKIENSRLVYSTEVQDYGKKLS